MKTNVSIILTAFCIFPTIVAQRQKLNVLFIFADQWRAQAMGYNGDINAQTPNFDAFAQKEINFVNTFSCQPVSSPYRASLLTGQYPTTHGLVANDLPLAPNEQTFGELFKQAGYKTGYIGKWHLFGHGRLDFIPAEKRFGFDFWKVMNCTHAYNESDYWPEYEQKMRWKGYDAFAQTDTMLQFIADAHKEGKPFCMVLSWGPPHDPYAMAPEEYKSLYADKKKIVLRPNVDTIAQPASRTMLSGYYAHIAALDFKFGEIIMRLKEMGVYDNTIIVFTSDHGDMIGSQGYVKKSRPYDESIHVPFLLHYPAEKLPKAIIEPMSTPDILPTLLDLCGLQIPSKIEGRSYLPFVTGKKQQTDEGALVMWPLIRKGYNLNEYRCLRTTRYTYVEELTGPTMLYDNEIDPYQRKNLVNIPEYVSIQKLMKKKLQDARKRANDDFLSDVDVRKKFGLEMNILE